MAEAWALVGIPTCGTVKKARAWMDQRGLPYQWLDLRQSPPSREVVADWVRALGAAALRNTSGASYRALPAERERWSDDRWIEAFAADPMLIKRPVVLRDGQAVAVGWRRPPDGLLRAAGETAAGSD
jgi:arsenate reductase